MWFLGLLPKKVLSIYLLMPESYLKGTKFFFFYIRSNTQMPLKNRNTILLPQIDWYSNSPFCIFYMNLVTILFFPKYFAFFCLLLLTLANDHHLLGRWRNWKKRRIQGMEKERASMASKWQRKENLEVKTNPCISWFYQSLFMSFIYFRTNWRTDVFAITKVKWMCV